MARRPTNRKYYRSRGPRGPSAALIRFKKLALLTTILALLVVILGAYTRLSDAGLGCPDWPGCYGQAIVPDTAREISQAQRAYPDRLLEPAKAWKEMVHRYFAGTLGLLVVALAILALRNRKDKKQPLLLPLLLVPLIVFQALLGMWTVTLLLKPVIVMAHLMGGMITLGSLWWLALSPARERIQVDDSLLARVASLVLLLLMAQIALGGWTSSNYAGMACPDFPTCQGQWWPAADFGQGFSLQELGGSQARDFEGGILGHPARVAIHLSHRLGALAVVIFNLALGLMILKRSAGRALAQSGIVLMGLTVLQVLLGIAIVELGLPLSLATAHNALAALLLLSLVMTNRMVRTRL